MPTTTAAATPTLTPIPTATPTPTPTHTLVPAHCRIKGNINTESGEKVYHTPDSPWYERTAIDTGAGERWFCTEREAQEAGWRAPKMAQDKPTPTIAAGNIPAGCKAIVNINTAGVDDLKTLPGIGDTLAQRIANYRSANGHFTTVDELDSVQGIGEKTIEKVKPCVILR